MQVIGIIGLRGCGRSTLVRQLLANEPGFRSDRISEFDKVSGQGIIHNDIKQFMELKEGQRGVLVWEDEPFPSQALACYKGLTKRTVYGVFDHIVDCPQLVWDHLRSLYISVHHPHMARFLERLETKWGEWAKDAKELLEKTQLYQFIHFDVPNKKVSRITLAPDVPKFDPTSHSPVQ